MIAITRILIALSIFAVAACSPQGVIAQLQMRAAVATATSVNHIGPADTAVANP